MSALPETVCFFLFAWLCRVSWRQLLIDVLRGSSFSVRDLFHGFSISAFAGTSLTCHAKVTFRQLFSLFSPSCVRAVNGWMNERRKDAHRGNVGRADRPGWGVRTDANCQVFSWWQWASLVWWSGATAVRVMCSRLSGIQISSRLIARTNRYGAGGNNRLITA